MIAQVEDVNSKAESAEVIMERRVGHVRGNTPSGTPLPAPRSATDPQAWEERAHE